MSGPELCPLCGNPRRWTAAIWPGPPRGETEHECPHGRDCGVCDDCDWSAALVEAGVPADA